MNKIDTLEAILIAEFPDNYAGLTCLDRNAGLSLEVGAGLYQLELDPCTETEAQKAIRVITGDDIAQHDPMWTTRIPPDRRNPTEAWKVGFRI